MIDNKRFAKQILLTEIGVDGQKKLHESRVLCVGAGGLGAPLLLYLAAAGVSTLGVVDNDIVNLDNLHRQILFSEGDIGLKKVHVVKKKLQQHNSNTTIHIYDMRITLENAAELISQYDIVADCTDNFAAHYLLNDICFHLQKPLVSASVSRFQGQCMTIVGGNTPCLRCLYPEIPKEGAVLNCDEGGVLGVLPGFFGIIQATEVIKWIVQMGELLVGRVLLIDLLSMQFREFQLPQNPDCELCVHYRMIPSHDYQQSCLRNSLMQNLTISPLEVKQLLNNKEDFQLIDVRTPEKHQAFNIGGKLIPFEELAQRLNELDPTKLIVTYCTSGNRSMRALELLASFGFISVKSLDGGMMAWQQQNL